MIELHENFKFMVHTFGKRVLLSDWPSFEQKRQRILISDDLGDQKILPGSFGVIGILAFIKGVTQHQRFQMIVSIQIFPPVFGAP